MQHLHSIDLRNDPAARQYVKQELVEVAFARTTGELMSLEGPNRHAPGDAIITASGGERWVVARERFAAKYEPVPPTLAGSDGLYRARPTPVLAKQLTVAFSIERSRGGDVLTGEPNDWLLQYAPGDYGVVKQARFAQVYRAAKAD